MNSPTVRLSFSLILTSLALMGLGWGGVLYLTTQTYPTLGPRWLFFAAWFIAITGAAIPFVHYLNKRFAKIMSPDATLLRQAIWVGLFGATCAWLELGSNALNWASALLLAAALAAIEGLLIMRDRSKRPFDDSATTPKR